MDNKEWYELLDRKKWLITELNRRLAYTNWDDIPKSEWRRIDELENELNELDHLYVAELA